MWLNNGEAQIMIKQKSSLASTLAMVMLAVVVILGVVWLISLVF